MAKSNGPVDAGNRSSRSDDDEADSDSDSDSDNDNDNNTNNNEWKNEAAVDLILIYNHMLIVILGIKLISSVENALVIATIQFKLESN